MAGNAIERKDNSVLDTLNRSKCKIVTLRVSARRWSANPEFRRNLENLDVDLKENY